MFYGSDWDMWKRIIKGGGRKILLMLTSRHAYTSRRTGMMNLKVKIITRIGGFVIGCGYLLPVKCLPVYNWMLQMI